MAKQFGLRTEIIINLCILVGAALLFSGFLLLNLMERELVKNQTESARQQLILAARLAERLLGEEPLAIRSALADTPTRWFLIDRNLQVVVSDAPDTPLRRDELNWIRFEDDAIVQLDYSSFYLFGMEDAETVTITVPLRADGRFAGALQGHFSLAPIREALAGATQFYLFFLLLYGGILLLFGFWLLGKAVVRPVRQLTAATARIAGGDLEPVAVPEGPQEIVDLANSFNHMTTALQESRAKTDHSIASLSQVNEELRQTRDELVRSERLVSVGHLAAGMAHEIGNPLGAIIGYIELLCSDIPPGREQEIAVRAGKEAQRIHVLVRDLLDYARPDPPDSEPVYPAEVLVEAVEMLSHQGALTGIDLVNEMPDALPRVWIPRHKLLQVCINLLVNARDAIHHQAENGCEKPGGAIRLDGGASNAEVWLTIGDNGSGIDPAILPHIFDPFFTTKAPGRGRGLGLAVCHRIITDSNGCIEVRATGEGGSTFTMRMKRLEAEP